MKPKSLLWIALIGVFLVLPLFINNVSAQTEPNYFVTVKSTTPDSIMYTGVGRNWTFSFVALWSFGPDSGSTIQNATATIQVTNRENTILSEISVNTTTNVTTDVFSFNYLSSTADILTFTPISLTTQDNVKWTNDTLADPANNVYAFQSNPVVVWWDTFHVSLVSYDTNSLGNIATTVNVTYQLLPEKGLSLPAGATYTNQTFLPKIVHEANVTINGVKAQETQISGTYQANCSTWLPTAYVHIGVSQEGWVTTHTGFSFTQSTNAPLWTYAVGFGSLFTIAILMLHVLLNKRAKKSSSIRHPYFATYGAFFLAATSIISLYWGIVGLEGTLNGFDWVLLEALGIVSFATGIVGSIMALRKKQQALVIFAVIVPLFVNVVGVKSSLDMYALTNPWVTLLASLSISIVSGYLISNSDKIFQNVVKKREKA